MKTHARLSVILTVFLMSHLAMGQIEVGVKTGATIADITTDGFNLNSDFLEPQSIVGLHAGVFAGVPLGSGFSFMPGVNYAQKGFRVRESIDLDVFGFALPIGAEAITRMHYLEMPLNLKYGFGQGNISGYVRAGPVLGYAMSGTVTARINSIVDIKVAEIDVDPGGSLYNAWELGGVAGAGVEFHTRSGRFFLDASYSHGFTDILNEPVVDLRGYNRGFGIGVGYTYTF